MLAHPRAMLLVAALTSACTKAGVPQTPAPAPAPEPAPDSGPARWTYEITIDDQLARMDLDLCIEGPTPTKLVAGPEALAFVRTAKLRGGPELRRAGKGFAIDELGPHGCIELDIDLSAAGRSESRDTMVRGQSMMIAPDRWLWYPSDPPDEVDARARLHLPADVYATLPWPTLEDGWRRLEHSCFGWNGWLAFSRTKPLEFDASGARFEVAILEGERQASDAGIQAWLEAAAASSAELHGCFPRERVAVVVIPMASSWGTDPVLFGMARRGGGGSVMLLLDREAEDRELLGEWVATHELLHLGLPLIEEAWMAEGFVTYYTTVLRARQGLLERDADHEQQIASALAQLARGFGRAEGRRSLAEASRTMSGSGAYAHVYWGGAGIAFDIDRAIRSASANQRSLDDLIRTIAPLSASHRRWSAAELLERMDAELSHWREVGEVDVEISTAELAGRLLEQSSLPNDIRELAGLAVTLANSRVRLLPDPIGEAQVRVRMFEPKSPSSAPNPRPAGCETTWPR